MLKYGQCTVYTSDMKINFWDIVWIVLNLWSHLIVVYHWLQYYRREVSFPQNFESITSKCSFWSWYFLSWKPDFPTPLKLFRNLNPWFSKISSDVTCHRSLFNYLLQNINYSIYTYIFRFQELSLLSFYEVWVAFIFLKIISFFFLWAVSSCFVAIFLFGFRLSFLDIEFF